MIKLMLIGIVLCWVMFFVGPVIIKAYQNKKNKKGENSEK